MEYISYILVTLGILVTCLLTMRLPPLPEQKKSGAARASKTTENTNLVTDVRSPEDIRHSRLVLQRELMHVPTPWGWPGHQGSSASRNHASPNAQEVNGVSESLYHFVDRLFSEKHTVDSREYLLRKDASLRALVEDRYGRASTMKEIPYQKVKPPRLRDPSEPHDQMDNFPSGKADQIAARIPRQPESSRVVKRQTPLKKTVGLADVRTPWGW